jgi:hypothetical protein
MDRIMLPDGLAPETLRAGHFATGRCVGTLTSGEYDHQRSIRAERNEQLVRRQGAFRRKLSFQKPPLHDGVSLPGPQPVRAKENSPAIHCWVRRPKGWRVPAGTKEAGTPHHGPFLSPLPGLAGSRPTNPSSELLGYSQSSLAGLAPPCELRASPPGSPASTPGSPLRDPRSSCRSN